jgi:penicillin-binding protein 1C
MMPIVNDKWVAIVVGSIAILIGLTYLERVTSPLQVVMPVAHSKTSEAYLLDRNGLALQRVRIDKAVRQLEWVALAGISDALLHQVILAEDQRFYQHGGVDSLALAMAVWQNSLGFFKSDRTPRGASTITMQLAGILDTDLKAGGVRRTFLLKLRQMRTAWQLEGKATKPQILEAYLNHVYFRGEQRGIASASAAFFAKAPIGLNTEESAILAVLLASPQAKSSLVAAKACKLLERASKQCVIDNMPVARLNKPWRGDSAEQFAPHFAERLRNSGELKDAGTYQTTIDRRLQQFAQQALAEQMRELASQRVEDGAVVVLDNASGDILAYVGSSGAFSQAAQVDAASALRQAGSTLKPFLYGMAIEQKRLTAASLLDDSALAIRTADAQYIPRNYSEDYKGWVSVRKALGSSLNIPAVRTLAMLDVNEFAVVLRNVGLKTVIHEGEYYGPSLALGSADVRLIDVANAYRTLANGGQYSELRLTSKAAITPSIEAISPAAAFIVADMLADNEARAASFGLDSPLRGPFKVSVKTGTSKDMRDNWCVGFTNRYTVAVWVGNASGAPMKGVSGVSGAAPIWSSIMRYAHQNMQDINALVPTSVIAQKVSFSGVPESERMEFFIAGTQLRDVILATKSARAANHITHPIHGAIYAIDPDIPVSKQVIRFAHSDLSAEKFMWRLDDKILSSVSNQSVMQWQLTPGLHRLELISPTGRLIEQVRFEVRAPALNKVSSR